MGGRKFSTYISGKEHLYTKAYLVAPYGGLIDVRTKGDGNIRVDYADVYDDSTHDTSRAFLRLYN